MRIKQLSLNPSQHRSFQVRQDFFPRHNLWHYHEELEFIQIKKGSGTLCIGDCIRPFGDGDIALIGSNIPHYWMFDNAYLDEENPLQSDSRVIQFKKDFCSSDFLKLPETSSLRELFLASSKGLFLLNEKHMKLHSYIDHILIENGLHQLSLLLLALQEFHSLPTFTLVSDNYVILNHSDDEKRMNDVVNYIREHVKQPIILQDLANLAGMTKNSFCRYFKQKTGKTPIEFITEIRIATACKYLTETDSSLKEVCFECGYNNFVSFHKAFKNVTGITPKNYKINYA